MSPLRRPLNPFDRWERSESGLHLPSRFVPGSAKRLHHIEKFGTCQSCCDQWGETCQVFIDDDVPSAVDVTFAGFVDGTCSCSDVNGVSFEGLSYYTSGQGYWDGPEYVCYRAYTGSFSGGNIQVSCNFIASHEAKTIAMDLSFNVTESCGTYFVEMQYGNFIFTSLYPAMWLSSSSPWSPTGEVTCTLHPIFSGGTQCSTIGTAVVTWS